MPHGSRMLTVEIETLAPGSDVVGVRQKARIVVREIANGSDMVVNRIEDDRQASTMTVVDERTHLVGSPVGMIGREQEDPVVAPVSLTRALGDRHDFDRGNAQLDQVIEMLTGRLKGSFLRKG